MSALWPRRAAVTTWVPASVASLTARTTASASIAAPARQKRWSTPRPTLGLMGSDAPPVVAVLVTRPV